jgi:hypothetical protein
VGGELTDDCRRHGRGLFIGLLRTWGKTPDRAHGSRVLRGTGRQPIERQYVKALKGESRWRPQSNSEASPYQVVRPGFAACIQKSTSLRGVAKYFACHVSEWLNPVNAAPFLRSNCQRQR